MTQQNTGIGEQVLNKMAEMRVSAQLADAESIDIDIRSEPLKLVQGEVNSVDFKGKGLVTLQDLRLEELELYVGNVAINLLSAISGKIELTQAADAVVRVVVTTSDINRALNSDYLRNQLRQVEIPVGKRSLRIDLQQAECKLPSDGRMDFRAEFLANLVDESYPADFRGILNIIDGGRDINLERGEFFEGKNLSLELTIALLEMINKLFKVRRFQYEDILLYLNHLEIETDKLTLWVKAHVEQVPS